MENFPLMALSVSDFKDLWAGFQSIAIVFATFLGGAWALFQFRSLHALDKARLELEKAKRELLQQSSLEVHLVTESFEKDGDYFLHVRVVMRNIGSGADFVDWTKASLSARRFYKAENHSLAADDQLLLAWRAPSMTVLRRHLLPGTSASESFLVSIPQAGVYYVEFAVHTSPAVKAEMIADIEKVGSVINVADIFLWRADTFVSVPNIQPNNGVQPTPASGAADTRRWAATDTSR
jgi:hypothetical protein